MAYKHILIAVDLSPESKVLVEKAVSMARPYNAKVSLIHVDVNYSDLYTGLIDVNLGDMQKRISEETHHALTELSTNAFSTHSAFRPGYCHSSNNKRFHQ